MSWAWDRCSDGVVAGEGAVFRRNPRAKKCQGSDACSHRTWVMDGCGCGSEIPKMDQNGWLLTLVSSGTWSNHQAAKMTRFLGTARVGNRQVCQKAFDGF